MMTSKTVIALECIAIVAIVTLLAPGFDAFRTDMRLTAPQPPSETQPQEPGSEKPTESPADGVADIVISKVHNGVGENDVGDEYIQIENRGGAAVNMKGWMLRASSGETYTLDDTTSCPLILRPGGKIRLWTRAGMDTCYDVPPDMLWFNLYWGKTAPTLNNAHDKVTLLRSNGEEAGGFSW